MTRFAAAWSGPLIAILSAAALLLIGCQSNQSGSSSSETTEQNPRMATEDTVETPQFSVRDLLQAARTGKVQRVRRAVQKGGLNVNASDQKGNTPLMLASYNGHSAVVKVLLARGARVEARNAQGRTPLMFAATGPFPETVSLLLKQGADPNATDHAEGWSPLMFAAAEGNREVVRRLLEQGADPSLTDQDDETAQTFAKNRNHTEVVRLLKEQQ